MSRILVTFPDPIAATLSVLRARFPDFVDTTGVASGHSLPTDRGRSSPFVQVQADATETRYPVLETSTVRVTVWHTSTAKALALAQLVRGLLLAYSGGAEVRTFSTLTGPIPASDPDSGDPLAYFTVAARLRPTPVGE